MMLSAIADEGNGDNDLTQTVNEDSRPNEDSKQNDDDKPNEDNKLNQDDALSLYSSDASSLPCLNANEVDARLVPLNRRNNEFYFLADALVHFIVSTDYFSYSH